MYFRAGFLEFSSTFTLYVCNKHRVVWCATCGMVKYSYLSHDKLLSMIINVDMGNQPSASAN